MVGGGGGGEQHPSLCVNESKIKGGAQSKGAQRGQNPLLTK